MDRIQSILANKFQGHKLAHFYLMSPAQQDNEHILHLWLMDLLKSFSHKNIENHPDILLIESDPEKKSYKWEELAGVYKFLNHAPLEWHQKIIYIADAHKITEVVANKLLKVLEEPPIPCTFFITNPLKKSLLHTIESRAINVQVPLQEYVSNNTPETVAEALNTHELEEIVSYPLHKFIEVLKVTPELEQQIINFILTHKNLTYQQVQNLQQHSKAYLEDTTFHNSPQYRFAQLFNTIHASTEQ